jgi:acetylglutamate kinase
MRVVEMVLSGKVNSEIVGLISAYGGRAIGLSGKDANLLRARKLAKPGVDLGFVGEIEAVNPEVLDMFFERNYMPVISPVGLGADGATFNINADVAAAEIAVAAKAKEAHLPHRRAGHSGRERSDPNRASRHRAGGASEERHHGEGGDAGEGAGHPARARRRRRGRARGGRTAAPQRGGELFTQKGVGTLVTSA